MGEEHSPLLSHIAILSTARWMMTGDAILAMQDFQILYRNSSIVQINELHITFISVRKLLFNYSYVKNNIYLMFLTFSMWTIFLGNIIL